MSSRFASRSAVSVVVIARSLLSTKGVELPRLALQRARQNVGLERDLGVVQALVALARQERSVLRTRAAGRMAGVPASPGGAGAPGASTDPVLVQVTSTGGIAPWWMVHKPQFRPLVTA